MAEEYRTIRQTGTAEVIEKKSRFLASAYHVENEEQAMALLEKTRKHHYDARHNCWAYVLGEKQESERASDDGEPSGTAGRPILEVIRHAELTFTFVVVTRYFGGTLLGTGGLVRAYTQAAEEAVGNALKAILTLSDELLVETDYSDVGKIQYLIGQKGLTQDPPEYGQQVLFHIFCKTADSAGLTRQITELTAGRAEIHCSPAGYRELKQF